MHLPFWTDLKSWINKITGSSNGRIADFGSACAGSIPAPVTKRIYTKRSSYWQDVKGNRLLKKLVKIEAMPLTQAQIEYMAGQAQSKMDKADSWARNMSGQAFERRTKV